MTLSLVCVEFSINHIMIISRQRRSQPSIHPSIHLFFLHSFQRQNKSYRHLKAQPTQPFLDFSNSVPIDFDGAARSDADVVIPRVEAEDGSELR